MTGLFKQQNIRWSLLVGAYIAFELLFLSYRGYDARFHWFTHFFVGASVALIIMSTITWRTRRAVRLPLLWLLSAHLFAMFPDVLFSRLNIAHATNWSDFFLLHIHSHFIPGRNITWYLIFITTLGLYLWVINERTARHE